MGDRRGRRRRRGSDRRPGPRGYGLRALDGLPHGHAAHRPDRRPLPGRLERRAVGRTQLLRTSSGSVPVRTRPPRSPPRPRTAPRLPSPRGPWGARAPLRTTPRGRRPHRPKRWNGATRGPRWSSCKYGSPRSVCGRAPSGAGTTGPRRTPSAPSRRLIDPGLDPADLLALVTGLAQAWTGRTSGSTTDDPGAAWPPARLAHHRTTVVEAVRRLIRPPQPPAR
ncbi:hypothetical protein QMF80_13230 [Streptomyces sp. G-G2]|nr:hypothetical protein [Streptomyces sp. G-G2]MDJ0381779.1 hypothetical protein [Streptomyces sp. G-G2]